SYFIQCFKKYFKTTPSTFIKMANHKHILYLSIK
ncbi:hypothetical protein, partial [Salmonella enterica]